VHPRVVGVGELVEHDALLLAHHALGQVARRFHAARARREDDLGAEGAHGLAALDRQVLRHDENHAVAADRRGHRQSDARVARGGLDQDVALADRAALLGAPDHRDRRPVLHRASRVIALQLREDDVVAFLKFGIQALQPHERRVADEILDGLVHVFINSRT
jgi:hypothetical protein